MNTYGDRFRLTTYGESHGLAVGAVIDGCPAGVAIDMDAVDDAMARRRIGAPRQEEDRIEWLSGLVDGITLGTPIAFVIRNRDARPEDYGHMEHLFRPGHADYTYHMKYGVRDHNGGGRASARETVARVVAGAIARQLMPEVTIATEAISDSCDTRDDTIGGTVRCIVTGVAAGVGEPLFGKLNAALASAMMSIPSAIGFEMGAGFATARMRGSEYIDRCNGMPIEFTVAFHPVVSLPRPVECLHEDGRLETVSIGGRHDTHHIERAAAVVEAMAALCLINYML